MYKEYIKSLEERILTLENTLKNISFGENKTLTFSNCHIENLELGGGNKLSLESCPIGDVCTGGGSKVQIENSSIHMVVDNEIDDAEDRIEDLED